MCKGRQRWGDASTHQGISKDPQEIPRHQERGTDQILSRSPQKKYHWHLDLGLLASKTMKTKLSGVKVTLFMKLCCSSLKRLIQHISVVCYCHGEFSLETQGCLLLNLPHCIHSRSLWHLLGTKHWVVLGLVWTRPAWSLRKMGYLLGGVEGPVLSPSAPLGS